MDLMPTDYGLNCVKAWGPNYWKLHGLKPLFYEHLDKPSETCCPLEAMFHKRVAAVIMFLCILKIKTIQRTVKDFWGSEGTDTALKKSFHLRAGSTH